MFKPIRVAEKQFSNSYVFGLFDSSFPFMYGLSSEVIPTLDLLQSQSNSPRTLAKNLFDYFCSTINYGTSKRQSGYVSAKHVWKNKEGVCGEMSYLYISAARYCGLKSSYTSVRVDNKGENVRHACATVWIPKPIQVDLAYNTFDISHQEIILKSDKQVFSDFLNWRRIESDF